MSLDKGLKYPNVNRPIFPTRVNVENDLFVQNPYCNLSFYEDEKYVPNINLGALTKTQEGLFSHFQQTRTQKTSIITPHAKPSSNSTNYQLKAGGYKQLNPNIVSQSIPNETSGYSIPRNNQQVFSNNFQKTKAKPYGGRSSRKSNGMPMKPPLHPKTSSRRTPNILQSDSLRRQAIINSFKANFRTYHNYPYTISNEENNIWYHKKESPFDDGGLREVMGDCAGEDNSMSMQVSSLKTAFSAGRLPIT
ncbi:hypothetical protein Leryth_012238 [Lithospermum erythrorhizon]|nr:hypothetical protein Leryth_012238 [Lithospermum erythrorhizon]